MFTVHCAQHGSRVLIFSSGVERVRNTEQGIEVDYRCTCGERGTWRTGRAQRPARTLRLAADGVARAAGAEYAVLRPLAAAGGGLA